MTDEPILIELDARNRASLGKLARHRRYLAVVESDGKIILTPAAVVPANTTWSEAAPGLQRAPLGAPPDAVVPLDTARVKVAFCSWCPEPEKPSPEFHPGGQSEHVEEVCRYAGTASCVR